MLNPIKEITKLSKVEEKNEDKYIRIQKLKTEIINNAINPELKVKDKVIATKMYTQYGVAWKEANGPIIVGPRDENVEYANDMLGYLVGRNPENANRYFVQSMPKKVIFYDTI